MAAGMIHTIGGSFWEFGGPDLERAKLFVMIGTAEDHHSNPMKAALGAFKRGGGRFIAINPITNAGQLLNQDEASDDFDMMTRHPDAGIVNPLRPANFWCWDRLSQQAVPDHADAADPALFGRYTLPDGTPVTPAFELL